MLQEYGLEFLSHKPQHVRMARWKAGAPFLMDEDSRDQRGLILDGRLNAGRLEGTVIISRTARGEELWMDLEDGIRRYISVQYILHHLRQLKTDEMSAGVQATCKMYKCKAFISEDWEPVAASSVAIPRLVLVRKLGG